MRSMEKSCKNRLNKVVRKIFLCMTVLLCAGCGGETAQKDTNIEEDALYIGEYLDYDNQEPNLEIAKGRDEKYIVQIGIFRLTTLSDGVGELTSDGMLFTATDAAGNPISGIITVESNIATVKFTDSTWSLLENNSVFQYTKSSDIPNLWME